MRRARTDGDADEEARPKKRARTKAAAPTAPAIPETVTAPVAEASDAEDDNDVGDIRVQDQLAPNVPFEYGHFQSDPLLHANTPAPVPHHIMPPLELQNTVTLLPPHVQPMVHLLGDFDVFDDLTPVKTVQMVCAPERFAVAARIDQSPDVRTATPALRAAVDTVLGHTDETRAEAARRTGHVQDPLILTRRPYQENHTIKLYDINLGQIHPLRQPNTTNGAGGGGNAEEGPRATSTTVDNTRRPAEVRFFANDPIPDPEHPFGLAPRDYPMFKAKIDELEALMAERETLQRETLLEARTSIPVCTPADLQEARQRPDPQWEELPCPNGNQCRNWRFIVDDERQPKHAYLPKSFQLPSERAEWRERRSAGVPIHADPLYPPRPCIECLTYAYKYLTYLKAAMMRPPQQPINIFQVMVGEGGYARSAVIGSERDCEPTGIVGFIPDYTPQRRMLRENPRTRLWETFEINVDFHMSLSQTDAYLGVRKARPLAGADGRSRHALSLGYLLQDPVAESIHASDGLWREYLLSLPPGVLADRALVLGPNGNMDGAEAATSRVPVVWLRHCLLSSFSLASVDDQKIHALHLSRVTTALRQRLSPEIRDALCQYLELSITDIDLDAHILTWLETALTTFERSVAFWQAYRPYMEPLVFLTFKRVVAEDTGSWAIELLYRAGGEDFEDRFDALYGRQIIWSVAAFRYAVARFITQVLRPWTPGEETTVARDICYNARLFAATHEELLACDPGLTPLDAVYPTANRVVCADEMPDLSSMFQTTNPFYDSPTKKGGSAPPPVPTTTTPAAAAGPPPAAPNNKKKQLGSLLYANVTEYLKQGAAVCFCRQFASITCDNIRAYPANASLIADSLRVALLGELPYAQAAILPLALRIHIAQTFHAGMDRQELAAWVSAHPLTTMRLLRECYLDAIRRDGVMQDFLLKGMHWRRFVAMHQQAVVQLRRFAVQRFHETYVASGGRGGYIPWDEYEVVEAKTSLGEALIWHNKQKIHNAKYRKGTEVDIMMKKMRPFESRPLPQRDAVYAWIRADGRLQAIQALAWEAAMHLRAPLPDDPNESLRVVVPLGPLKWCGLSEETLMELRYWVHGHWEYQTSDHSFVHVAKAIMERNAYDFVVLKLYLRFIDHYMNDVLFYLPVEQVRIQLRTLRQALSVEPWCRTPAEVGWAYYCEGCLEWATPGIRPSYILQGIHPTKKQHHQQQVALAQQQAVAGTGGNHHLHGPQSTLSLAATSGPNDGAGPKRKKKRYIPFPMPPVPIGGSHPESLTVGKAYYDPLRARHYCRKYRPPVVKSTLSTTPKTAADLEEEAAVLHDLARLQPRLDDEMVEAEEGNDDVDDADEDVDAAGTEAVANEREDQAITPAALPSATIATAGSTTNGKNRQGQDLAQPLFPPDLTCQAPLRQIDLVGVYKTLKGRTHGRCVDCGFRCELVGVNLTNDGLTCGQHAHPSQYEKSHRIWRHIRRPDDADDIGALRPLVATHCHFCSQPAEELFDVYDITYRMFALPLCMMHTAACAHFLPQRPGFVAPPMAYTYLATSLRKYTRF